MKKIFFIISVVVFLSVAISLAVFALDTKDEEFLDMVEKNAFNYFLNEVGTHKNGLGLVQDRMTNKRLHSTLAGGYHLTALCIGSERGWISRKEAAKRVLLILKTYKSLPRFHGIFAHFYDIETGKVVSLMHKEDDGADISETAFLMGGVLTALAYFDRDNPIENEIRPLAQELYEEVEWDWMLWDDYGDLRKTLSWHWSPRYGFKIGQRVKSNMELSSMLTYLLAIGSPTHPIPKDCWYEGWCKDYRWGEYEGNSFITCPPIFTHQFAHTWVDFRYKKDRLADYFRNSVYASMANREYCLKVLYPQDNIWGLTFCDGPFGYGLYGYPPKVGEVDKDATIAPSGAGNSIVFCPSESISSLKYMHDKYHESLWGKYGFTDSFSPKHDWFDDDYIGIDQGCLVAMIENYRSGFAWNYFMKNKYIKNALDKIGFVGIIDDFEQSKISKFNIAAPYSVWSHPEKEKIYRYNIYNKLAKEGNSCLRVKFNKRKNPDAYFFSIPALRNFSDYKYLSFWLYKGVDLHLKLENDKGEILKLKKMGQLKLSDGWVCVYYSLAGIEKSKLINIDKVIFIANPGIKKSKGTFYLDAVFLTNNLAIKKPPKVTNIKARAGYTPTEIVLNWSYPEKEKPYRYIIKYYHRPITKESTFEKVKDVRYLGGVNKECVIDGLRPKRTYFFSLKAEDKSYNTSDLSKPVEAKTASRLTSLPVIDDFEDGDLNPPYANWDVSSRRIKLETSALVVHDGSYSLKINYNKKGEKDKWAHLLAEVDYHNFSKYRYLSMWVYGKVDILAKLYNSQNQQEDISIQSATNAKGWTRLFFDFSDNKKVDKETIKKVFLFIEPGKINCSQTIYIDTITLSNSAN